jgi:hypothetical protein
LASFFKISLIKVSYLQPRTRPGDTAATGVRTGRNSSFPEQQTGSEPIAFANERWQRLWRSFTPRFAIAMIALGSA